ncbi:hypothetical protein BKA58DRAFT_448009 [Alternaria rosae]|uniref:uncharacterized protein n=1 Tax=Alternaria rosae TaxID=1187941 RepID=UPI001E8D9294|nr:uncharacterized protein BKA58DRAFT_448009 [Alternaria rosae]KAH6883217.1 hypothetical protein BKA58DRAFT_448009 [Alternaria rosae]
MKLSSLLSTSATFLLAAATPDESSLAEAMRSLEPGDGITWLADDGVLLSFNAARDTVIDYAQLNERQIAEYTKRYDKTCTDIDGRAVTSATQLWAVLAGVVARTSNARTSENLKVPKTLIVSGPGCVEGAICNETPDYFEYNCLRCVPVRSTPGECLPQGGCPSIPSPNGECAN